MKCIEYKKKWKEIEMNYREISKKIQVWGKPYFGWRNLCNFSYRWNLSTKSTHTHTKKKKTQHNLDPVFFKEEHVIV